MSRFAEQAQRILDAATSAASHGETCSEMTILIGTDGGIQMIANSDWPLDSLALERGAKSAYRVSERGGRVRVEAREGSSRCVLESNTTARTARLLLGDGVHDRFASSSAQRAYNTSTAACVSSILR